MAIKIKQLPLTEEMYNYLINYRIKYDRKDGFYQVKDAEEWLSVTSNDTLWYSKRHIYVVGDHFYILTQRWLFASAEFYSKMLKQLTKKRLNSSTYFYIWHYCPSDSEEANKFWNTKEDKYLDGGLAYNMVCKEIFKHYSDSVVEEKIKEYGVKDEDTSVILHYHPFTNSKLESNVIYKVENVAYYDLNKAYASNLIKFFPKIKDWCLKGYRKDKPYFKKVVNYAVGCFQNNIIYGKHPQHNFHNLRNAIITDTTQKVQNALKKLTNFETSKKLYVNTDGLIVVEPISEINYSNNLGDFGKKIIDNDTLWFVKVDQKGYKKYMIMQWFENGEKVVKVIGGFRQCKDLLEHTDLSKGIVPLFNDAKLNVQTGAGVSVAKIVDKESIKEIKLNEQKY